MGIWRDYNNIISFCIFLMCPKFASLTSHLKIIQVFKLTMAAAAALLPSLFRHHFKSQKQKRLHCWVRYAASKVLAFLTPSKFRRFVSCCCCCCCCCCCFSFFLHLLEVSEFFLAWKVFFINFKAKAKILRLVGPNSAFTSFQTSK